VNRNRVSVRVCRELAALGVAAFRPDFHGAGDSTGPSEKLALDRPYSADVQAAAQTLRQLGAERIVLAGSCFGGRSALSAAPLEDDVHAVILIATSLHDYEMGERKSARAAANWSMGRYVRESVQPRRIRGLFTARSRRSYAKYVRAKLGTFAAWNRMTGREAGEGERNTEVVSPLFATPLRRLLDRGGRVLFIFGKDDTSYEEYLEAAAGPLADVLGGDHPGVEVTVVPGKIHGFLSIAAQDLVVDEIARWMAADRSAPALARPRVEE
jgi:dienelactone hydrolase